jgi:hypothetical protein
MMHRIGSSVLLMAALASGCTRVDRQLFTGLDRTSQAILAEVPKVGLERYRELTTSYTNELTAAHARAQTSAERAALEPYDSAQTGLKDILAVWSAKDTTQSDMLPVRDEMAGRIAKTYGLPVNTNEPPSIYAGEAMQIIWDSTKARLTQATSH